MKTIILVEDIEASRQPPAINDEWEVGIVNQGECTCLIEDKTHWLTAGFAFICPPGCEHYYEAAEGVEFKCTVIRFLEGGMPKGSSKRPTITKDEGGSIKKLFSIAKDLFDINREEHEITISHITEAICGEIVARDRNSKCSSTVYILKERIETEFYDAEFKVPKVVAELGYNPDYMRRLFKAELGISPSDYLNDVRLENAKRLLITSKNASVAQIAYQCGFYDSNYFTRLFKAKVGLVPSDYRKAVLKGK